MTMCLVEVRLCKLRVYFNSPIKVFECSVILFCGLVKESSLIKHDLVFLLFSNDLRQLRDCIGKLVTLLKNEGKVVSAF